MATSFPSNIDTFNNPTANTALNAAGYEHWTLHTDINDAVEALEAKVGVDGSAVTTSLDYRVSAIAPVGMVVWWPSLTPPPGWLLCDGSEISRTSYADLFAVTSTTYGAGDGSTTFNLPSASNRFVQGWNTGLPANTVNIANIGNTSTTASSGQSHSHSYYRANSGFNSTTGTTNVSHTHQLNTFALTASVCSLAIIIKY